MSSPYDGIVTRPDHYDPSENYALVVARGDYPLGDYDIIDAQEILRGDLSAFGNLLVQEGAIITETGGTIGTPQAGTPIGGDAIGAGGAFVGMQSQVYTIRVLATGAGGTATYTYASSGMDNPNYTNEPFPIPAVAPDVATGLADLATYGCPVGRNGVQVVFVNSTGQVHGGSTWSIQATFGASPPVISGNSLILSDVIVFMGGKVHRIKGTTLGYPAATPGMASIVYGEWLRTIVTSSDDPTLTDPLSGQPQAYRERWAMTYQAIDTSGLALPPKAVERRVVALYRWDRDANAVTAVQQVPYRIPLDKTEGSLPAARLVNVDQSVLLGGLLAERTYDANGDFVAEPGDGNPRAYPSTNAADPGKLRVTIPPAIAYIQGVRFESDAPQDIQLDQATDTGSVLGEAFTFSSGTLLYQLAQSKAGYPISAITRVQAMVQVLQEPATRASSGQVDAALQKQPVFTVEKVYQGPTGAPTTVWTPTTDYTLVGPSISWVAGKGPALNAAYNVDYTYNKQMTAGADYKLTGGSVDFSDPGGDLPKQGTNFTVDYNYFLWRTDGVMIRPTGEIAVVRGTPSQTIVQPVLPLYALPYCLVAVAPGGSQVTISQYNNDGIGMVMLCNMRDAIGKLTNDVARLNLGAQAQALTTGGLIDIITDAFSTTDTADMTYNAGGQVFDATIDTTAMELTLPYTQQIAVLTPTQPGTGVPGTQLGGAFYALPHVDELAINAPKWSTDYPVNPYDDFRPEPPSVQAIPDRDFWIDTISLSSTSTRIIENGRHESWNIVGAFTTTQTQVKMIPYLYMRQIGIAANVLFLVPGEKVRCQMDGKNVPITATGGTVQIDANTVQASMNTSTDRGGSASFSFTVPALVPSGTAPIVIFGDNAAPGSTWPASYAPRCDCTFTSTGEIRLITTESIVTLVQNDPVAQSVIFPQPRMISKVVVPIAATPPLVPTSPPLLCEVRATDQSGEASSPIQEVLAQVSKPASQWATDGTAVFRDPVYTPANTYRAVVMRSSSNLYRVYVAQLGGPDRTAGGFISAQQIPSGIFMDSSNNSDWTLRQDWDLRCQVYVAKMTAMDGYLYYLPVTITGGAGTGIFLTVDQNAPDACTIQWQYSIDNGSTWTNFNAFAITEFSAVAATVQLRAHLITTDAYSSPVIHATNAALHIMSNKAAGKYVSKMLTCAGKLGVLTATHIEGQFDCLLPGGLVMPAAVQVYVTCDNATTWTNAPATKLGTAADGYTIYTFKAGVPTALPTTNPATVRVRVDLATPNKAWRPHVKRLYAYAMQT